MTRESREEKRLQNRRAQEATRNRKQRELEAAERPMASVTASAPLAADGSEDASVNDETT